MKNFSKIEGLIAPVFTPMKENGDITTEIIPRYAEDLKSKGINGVFVLGSTGEGMLLTTEERKMITEAWSSFAGNELKMIVHVGSTSYRQSQELAAHARDNGAWAISCMGPTFLQPQTVEDLIEFCKKVASAAPDIPFYYYHIPGRSGIKLSMVDFLNKGKNAIPNLAGIKYTHSNFMEMQQCLNLDGGRFDITHGPDESLLCGLSIGVRGAIGTSYNFIPGLYQEIISAFEEGDHKRARALQLKSVKIIEVIIKYRGGIVAGKAIMKLAGFDCGPCRVPLKSLSPEEIKDMEKELRTTDFFNLLSIQKKVK
jgi:N-acetylneuraminate lyase